MTRIHITHVTEYAYDGPVPYGIQQVRMTPKATRAQTVVEWSVTVDGGTREVAFQDHHRNHVDLFAFEAGAVSLRLVAEGTVKLEDTAGVLGPHEGYAPLWLYQRSTERTRAGKGLREILADVPQNDDPLRRLHDLSTTIRNRIGYRVGASFPDWGAEEAIAAGEGVCQDHSHIFVAAARAMGHPARYVSGYLMMDDQVDQTAMHAWAEAHVDGLGWVGFDVSNGISPDTRYVRVATGLDYGDAAPVTGKRTGVTGERLTVHVRVAAQQ